MTLADKRKQDEKSDHAARGPGFFKFKEGINKIRILAEPQVIFKDFKLGICYTGCGFQGAMKYLTYVIDYDKVDKGGVMVEEQTLRIMEMPMTVFQFLEKWEVDEDYAFTAFPMPYDITIDANGAGTKEVKYVATPRPVRSEISEDMAAQLAKKMPIPELIAKMKESNKEHHMNDGTYERIHSGKVTPPQRASRGVEYPTDDINPDDIPF